MKMLMRFAGIASAILLAAVFFTAPASAQATRTWISGVGDDVNPCSRTAPCKTFPGAIAKTAAGGEIDTLDPGGFGAVTVTKSITLADEGVGEGGILVAGTNGVTVNCTTDPNCVVIVRGLIIDGGPTGSNSLSGIKFIAGKALVVQNCVIRNFTGGSPNGYGISFTPSASNTEQLDVTDSTITTNGQLGSSVGAGIYVAPTGSPNINVSIKNTKLFDNDGTGFKIDASGAAGGTITAAITDSVIGGNTAGIALANSAGGTNVNVNIDGTTIGGNNLGVAVNGANLEVAIGRSQITGNAFGVVAAGGGHINSYGDNAIHDNTTTNGTPTPITRN